jgi:hypothetical protein
MYNFSLYSLLILSHFCAGGSAELRALLGNTHLQAILKGVDSASNASNAMEKAMQEPIFTEFVDSCMKIVEPQSSSDL